MKKKKNAFKVVASVLSLSFYLFMATGSDESSSDSTNYEESDSTNYEESDSPSYPVPVYTPSKPIEREPVFSNDELEEEQDTILMKDTYDNDDILEE